MEADKYGTHAEQTRFAQGWLSPKLRPQCGRCKHREEKIDNPDTQYESTTYRCSLGNFATAKTAICNHYSQKDMQ